MPQTLTDWWKDHLSEKYESDHESWFDNVGNLSLTGYNSEMSNYDFQTNKDILISSHLELNSYFRDINEWNVDQIRKRV